MGTCRPQFFQVQTGALTTVLFTCIPCQPPTFDALALDLNITNRLRLDNHNKARGSCTTTAASIIQLYLPTMPKVKSYSAAWLSKNAPGHRLFEPSPEASRSNALSQAYSSRKKSIAGPRRTIAKRGTEVFVANGREIRWGDLAYLKEEWANRRSQGRSGYGPRIRREDSAQSVGSDADLESGQGMRVSSLSGVSEVHI